MTTCRNLQPHSEISATRWHLTTGWNEPAAAICATLPSDRDNRGAPDNNNFPPDRSLPGSPDRYDPQRPNLMKLLHAAIAAGKPWARERHLTYLMNAHRLDFETSGVMLLAKNKPALVALANLFGSEKPLKKYVALVRGTH